MERFKRRFSLRKKKDHTPESSKPHQWQEDEKKVRDATCSFQVRYLGCIEVFESRGIQVCEEAVKSLKSRQHRSVWSRMSIRKKKQKDQQCKGKYQRAVLYVSGDALRVVDEISKGLIVDQTIEKVSFCAPDRNHEKGFAYICRDGTTRRWMCHGFLAVKESGERLSHAVGCAFAICLEKKQKRDKDAVSVTYNDKGTSFTRMGSFRQATLTERMQDPQSVIIAETGSGDGDTSSKKEGEGMENPVAVAGVAMVERPRASEDMLQRQASFRGFSKLSDNSPFKRQLSLRLNELPSNLARQEHLKSMGHSFPTTNGTVEAIEEVSPSKEQEHISDLCEQIQGLSAALEMQNSNSTPPPQNTATPSKTNSNGSTGPSSNIPGVQPIRQTNPWDTPPAFRHNSAAESWLQSTATSVSTGGQNTATNGTTSVPQINNGNANTPTKQTGVVMPSVVQVHTPPSNLSRERQIQGGTPPLHPPPLGQIRSQTVDSGDVQWYNNQKAPTLRELQQRNQLVNFHSQKSTTVSTEMPMASKQQPNGGTNPWGAALGPTTTDPFDAAWATKSPNTPKSATTNSSASSNPFQAGDSVTQTFKLQL